MNAIDIDTLEAGPETDALVAEALGHQVFPGTAVIHGEEVKGGLRERVQYGNVVAMGALRKYSTDWNAAMEAADAVDLWSHCSFWFGDLNQLDICKEILRLKEAA